MSEEQRGLVEGRPVAHAVAEHIVHRGGRSRGTGRRCRGRPAALLLHRLREVPVVQREPGEDAGLEQFVDEPAVEGEPLLVDGRGRPGLMRAQLVEKR
jgi:hypothetical protein